MAKTQKTLVLNEELCALVQSQADKTGTSFSRVVTAAVLEHFFSQMKGPDQEWISLAVALEKGNTTLAGVPTLRMEDYANFYETQLREAIERGADKVDLSHIENAARTARWRAETWRRRIDAAGGGLKGLLDVLISGFIVTVEPVRLDLEGKSTKKPRTQ